MSTKKNRDILPVDISKLPEKYREIVTTYKGIFCYNPEEVHTHLEEKQKFACLFPNTTNKGRTYKRGQLTPDEEDLLDYLKTLPEVKKNIIIHEDEDNESDIYQDENPGKSKKNTEIEKARKLAQTIQNTEIEKARKLAKSERNIEIEKSWIAYLKSVKNQKGGRRTKRIRRVRKKTSTRK